MTLGRWNWPGIEVYILMAAVRGTAASIVFALSPVDALGEIISGPIVGLIGLARSIQAALVTSALLLMPVVPLLGRASREVALEGSEAERAGA